MIEMIVPFRAVSELDVARFERLNNVLLPKLYRRFLREQNGGRPKDGDFPVPGWGVTGIDFFFGIETGDGYDLQKHIDRLANPLAAELFPIANDPGGWLVYLAVRGPYVGALYFWDHKSRGAEPVLLAKNFESFAVVLKPDGGYDDYEFGMPPGVGGIEL